MGKTYPAPTRAVFAWRGGKAQHALRGQTRVSIADPKEPRRHLSTTIMVADIPPVVVIHLKMLAARVRRAAIPGRKAAFTILKKRKPQAD